MYNKKTGETYWENPIIDLTAVDEIGDVPQESAITEKKGQIGDAALISPSAAAGTYGRKAPPSALKMRQHMLMDYETVGGEDDDEAEEGPYARERARAEAKRKRAVEMRYRDSIGVAKVMRGKPLQAVSRASGPSRERSATSRQNVASQVAETRGVVSTPSEPKSAPQSTPMPTPTPTPSIVQSAQEAQSPHSTSSRIWPPNAVSIASIVFAVYEPSTPR